MFLLFNRRAYAAQGESEGDVTPSDAEKNLNLKMLIEPCEATSLYYFICNSSHGCCKITLFLVW